MHLSVLFHHKNGKTTIKTESLPKHNNKIVCWKHAFISTFLQQSSVDHDYDYIQFIQQTPTIQ